MGSCQTVDQRSGKNRHEPPNVRRLAFNQVILLVGVGLQIEQRLRAVSIVYEFPSSVTRHGSLVRRADDDAAGRFLTDRDALGIRVRLRPCPGQEAWVEIDEAGHFSRYRSLSRTIIRHYEWNAD